MSPMEFVRLQEELQKRNAELAAANAALMETEHHLERRVQERTRELSTLLNISRDIATTLELEPLLGLILDQLKTVVDYTSASINSLEGDTLQAIATRSRLPQEMGRRIRYPVDEVIDRQVISSHKPLIVADIHADTPLAHHFWSTARENALKLFGSQAQAVIEQLYGDIHTWARFPLVSRDQVIGMLTLSHQEIDYYSPRQVELAMAFANQAAVVSFMRALDVR